MAKRATLTSGDVGEKNYSRDIIRYIEDPGAHIFRGRRPGFGVWPEYPVAEDDEMLKRATSGSAAFTKAEIRQGYRRLGKG